MTSLVKKAALAPLFFASAVLIGGCATDTTSGTGSRQSAPASRYNLAGYSAAFKQGHADACASPRRRSEQRYKADTDYQMGWNDGQSVCRGR